MTNNFNLTIVNLQVNNNKKTRIFKLITVNLHFITIKKLK